MECLGSIWVLLMTLRIPSQIPQFGCSLQRSRWTRTLETFNIWSSEASRDMMSRWCSSRQMNSVSNWRRCSGSTFHVSWLTSSKSYSTRRKKSWHVCSQLTMSFPLSMRPIFKPFTIRISNGWSSFGPSVRTIRVVDASNQPTRWTSRNSWTLSPRSILKSR